MILGKIFFVRTFTNPIYPCRKRRGRGRIACSDGVNATGAAAPAGRPAPKEGSKMTFSLLAWQSRKLLSLGACHHHALNAAMPDRVRDALRRAKWTCHVCGAYLPGFLEIEHFDWHKPGTYGPIAPICQFCHDLEHPLWAVARDRMVPVIMPPEISQRTLTRLCWLIISCGLHWPDTARQMQDIVRKLRCRERVDYGVIDTRGIADLFESVLSIADFDGAQDAEEIKLRCRERVYDCVIDMCSIADLFESVLSVVDFDGPQDAEEIAQFLDDKIRFLPSAVIDISVLRTWSVRGLVPVGHAVLHSATRQPFSRGEIAALISRFMFLKEEGPDGDVQDDSDGAASCDSDCRPDCDARGDADSPSARTANMDAAPSPRTEAPDASDPRCGAQGAQASSSEPTRKSNHEGIES